MSALTAAVVAAVSLILVLLIVTFAVSVYFFRLTVLRKPTATMEKNINANTDWSKHIPFLEERKKWLNEQETEDVYVTSDDNLRLHGTLLECGSRKNCVICFHGYTSKGTNDFGAISKFYNSKNFNVIMVDERSHGDSEGKYIGFGVLDRMDALKWIEFARSRFGTDVNIFLHGISMGASTVLMTSGLDLPQNVKAIVADCGFTNAYDVFSHILKRDYHIPKFPLMKITEIMTRKTAGYGYNDVSTLNEVAKTNVPILFIHGKKDDFVPVWMSEKNFAACNSPKELIIFDNADHAESYFAYTDAYEKALSKYIDKYAV